MPRNSRKNENCLTHNDRLVSEMRQEMITRKRVEYLLLVARSQMKEIPEKRGPFDRNVQLLKTIEKQKPAFWEYITCHAQILRDMNHEFPTTGKIAFVVIGQRFFKGKREDDEDYDYDISGPRTWVTHVSESCIERNLKQLPDELGNIGSEAFYRRHLRNLISGQAVEIVASPDDAKPSMSFAIPAGVFTSLLVK